MRLPCHHISGPFFSHRLPWSPFFWCWLHFQVPLGLQHKFCLPPTLP